MPLRAPRSRRPVAAATLLFCFAAAVRAAEPDSAARRVRELLAADRWQEATEAARSALTGRADDADLAAAFAEALYRGGKIDEARKTVDPLLAGPKPPARALLVAAMTRAAAGDDAAATELFERAAAADPADREVLFRAADGVSERARAVELLQAYLARSEGDDPDRIDAARGSLAFQRALGQRKVWIPEARPARVELPLQQIGARGRTQGLLIDARLCDGKPVRLLLDSGSTGLFVVARAAKRCRFEALAVETTFGGGGDERHRTRRGILPTFAAGGLKFRDALATVSDSEIDPAGRYQGIVGLQPFGGYRIALDLDRGTLVLDEPPAAASPGVPYWSVAGQMLVEANSGGEASGMFVFDTGATASLISLPFAERARRSEGTGEAAVRGFGGDVRGARTVRGVNLRFIDLELKRDAMAAVDLSLRSRMGGTEVSGFLGMDLLAGHRWIIDSANRTIAEDPAARRRK